MMKKEMRLGAGFVLALVLAIMWSNIAAAATFQLYGKVTNQSDSPLADVLVEVLDPATDNVLASATTDAGGNYVLSIESGTYNIRVTPPTGSGFGEATAFNQVINSDKNLDFVLVPAGIVTLSGQVLDALGNGIPGQNVTLSPAGGGSGTSTTTDAQGNYSLQSAAGDYMLQVNRNNVAVNAPWYYVIRTTQFDFSLIEDTYLDLTLPVKRVEVHVQDPTGNPVANVGITTNGPNNPNLSLADLSASGWSYYGSPQFTNAEGNVTLWLFSTHTTPYAFTATPPEGTPFATFNISNVTVDSDRSMIIVLQFVHPPPVTTATVNPFPDAQGIFPGPVTVTLSATATDGFTVDAVIGSINDGPTQTYTEPFVIADDGINTVRYWSVDNIGVFESPKTLLIEIAPLEITT
ncbi:MAG: carboxypeptidase-like regulatory domain-containing protein, partial [Chloroflexota bacterium]